MQKKTNHCLKKSKHKIKKNKRLFWKSKKTQNQKQKQAIKKQTQYTFICGCFVFSVFFRSFFVVFSFAGELVTTGFAFLVVAIMSGLLNSTRPTRGLLVEASSSASSADAWTSWRRLRSKASASTARHSTLKVGCFGKPTCRIGENHLPIRVNFVGTHQCRSNFRHNASGWSSEACDAHSAKAVLCLLCWSWWPPLSHAGRQNLLQELDGAQAQ